MTPIPTTSLPDGAAVPVLGIGTWGMGEDVRRRAAEVAALAQAFDAGMTLVDTAESYGDGGAEAIVGEAILGRRDAVFLVSKVLPTNATRRGTIAACERSLKRLRTDRIDLYLLHWRGRPPLAETIDAFEELVGAGKIRRWGVSNFDIDDCHELASTTGGCGAAANQVLYNLTRRGIEFDLMPWCAANRMPIMAYSPIEQGRLLDEPCLKALARRHGATPAQIALAWVLARPGVIAIPKAARPDHIRDNRACLEVRLSEQDLADLDEAFPPPRGPEPLEML